MIIAKAIVGVSLGLLAGFIAWNGGNPWLVALAIIGAASVVVPI